MAEDQFGGRKDGAREWPGWTRLFGAFKVALDYKKLLLAAAGILVMAFGWWLLSVLVFALAGGVPPQWDADKYRGANQSDADAFANFKNDRRHWNFTYRMAGTRRAEGGPLLPDAADFADTLDEYNRINDYLAEIRKKNKRFAEPIQIKRAENVYSLVIGTGANETPYVIKEGAKAALPHQTTRCSNAIGRPVPAFRTYRRMR